MIADSGVEARDVAGIGLSGQMHGLVLLDADGDVGQHNSLVLDASGDPVVSYFDLNEEDLKVAFG